MIRSQRPGRFFTTGLILLLTPGFFLGYSVQTHEQLIDFIWKDSIVPLLRERFPGTTATQLERAHAYAYGGSAIQDVGYYPFGNEFFSDLTHYVRSGDFVGSLLRNARSAEELAFAIGALSHYLGDSVGHADAVNPAVAMEFPKLRERYGSEVVYGEGPHAHVRTEFAFDINQISKRRFAPSGYLRRVGLNVPEKLLADAFFETYGLNVRDILGKRRPTVRSYRFAVRSFLPRIAYAEALLHGGDFPADTPTDDFKRFQAQLAQIDIENQWSRYRKKPGFRTYLIAFIIVIVPKIGPLSDLAIRGPNEETEEWYVKSVNRSIDGLRRFLTRPDAFTGELPNRDLDSGERVRPGAYRLTDKTYAKLLHEITRDPARNVPSGLKENVLAYYSDPNSPIATKDNHQQWARVQAELATLSCMKSPRAP
jgi:hypothetical protein